jgi:ATP-dependent DNA helicase RecG
MHKHSGLRDFTTTYAYRPRPAHRTQRQRRTPCIEAKRARKLSKSITDTMIAFGNESGLGGGHLLLGVNWEVNDKGDTRYWAEGVPDPDKLQQNLATQCASMLNTVLRPEMAVERVDGKTLMLCKSSCSG